jgi:putative nucleotidyltransferase with HDIG domain
MAELNQAIPALERIQAPAWLVGGALRDRLLQRRTADFDVVVDGDVRAVARDLAGRISGHPFELSEGFGAWRVVSHDRQWNVDVLPLTAGSIENDLARRDLTINAIAQRLPGGELIDPFGGMADLRERRLRMVSADAFRADPLRALRLVRLVCELGFEAEAETQRSASDVAPALADVAPERVFAELKRIIGSDLAPTGLGLMDELGITSVLLPEVSALHGVEQSPYHHLDVYEHTVAVLEAAIELERDPGAHLGPHAQAVDEYLSDPLANEMTRWEALRLGALLHDIAKPQTRSVTSEGRVTFIGHDARGSEMVRAILGRLRASERLRDHVAAVTRQHLRLGFLVHETPLGQRAVYRYLRECDPVQVDVTVLSVADRLATRGVGSEAAIDAHLKLAGQLLGDAIRWAADPPRAPIRGDELAEALGVPPGPELGEILAELEEASFAGELGSPEEAVERAQRLLRQRSIGSRS